MTESFPCPKRHRYLVNVHDVKKLCPFQHHSHELRISLCYKTRNADAEMVLAEIFNMFGEPSGRFFFCPGWSNERFVLTSGVFYFDGACRFGSTQRTSAAMISTEKANRCFCYIDRRLYCSILNCRGLIIICFVLENGRHVWANEYHGVNLAIDVLGETYVFGQTVFEEALTVETTKKGSLTEEIKIFSSPMKLVPISVEI